jgi:hypothetical protein
MPQFPLFLVHVLLVLQVLREKPSILFPLLVYRFLARTVSGWPITLQQWGNEKENEQHTHTQHRTRTQ